MKPHVRLKVKGDLQLPEVPHWQQLLTSKVGAATQLDPAIDAIFGKYHLPVWFTKEYRPMGAGWDRSEIASGLDRIYRVIVQDDRSIPPELVKELAALPMVEQAEIGQIGRVDLPEMLPTQMSIDTDSRSREAIYLKQSHQYSQGNPEIKIAVLDTGVNLSHPELRSALLPGYDFVNIIDGADRFLGDYLDADDSPEDEVGHGTHVAGIIAAKGVAMPIGVVPHCKIMPVRVLAAMSRGNKRVGAGLVDNINAGIKWAIDQGADVINMSLGIRHTGGGLPHQEVVDYAQRKGVSIVAASGNDGQEQLYYPAALPYVITVGAVDEQGDIAGFSTYGHQVDLAAPGTNIYSSHLNNAYAFSTGTSHASPFVAGAVALLKSYALKKKGTNLSDSQIKHILKHTADKIDARFKHRKAGFGRLNLLDALRLLDDKLS
ncbi:MAG: S8 family serine peptidase [Elainella sp. Prado103]|jgi:subtilisin family serine protease|nr:S8 family serine peptidase [Elainella sp. Prado103]